MARPRTVDPEKLNPKTRLIGSRIRAARTRADLTQVELAKALGIRQTRLSAWEVGRNRPSPEHLEAISEATGAPLDYLYGDARWDQLSAPA